MSRTVRSILETLVSSASLVPEGNMERWRIGRGEQPHPAAVVAPTTEEELALVLARSGEEGWTVMPAGSGTWLEGGGPSKVTLVVSTQRMAEVKEYEPADLTLTAGAGISLANLRGITEPHRQWLPLDPPGGLEGSLGATAALGSWGPLRHLYGTPRDHVLGLTLVSGDGRILRWGGRVVKNVAGFDVTRLSIGSWGTLGVVTSVSTRLFPIPQADVTLCIRGGDVADLLAPAREMALSSMPLAAVELVHPMGTTSLGRALTDGEAGEARLILRLLGSREQVAEMERRVRSDLSRAIGGLERLEGEESRTFHGLYGEWERGADLVARLSLLPSEMGELLEEGNHLSSLPSSGSGRNPPRLRLAAHMGAGVLRLAVTGLPGTERELGAWVTGLLDLRGRLEERGGSLTISTGPDSLVRAVGAWGAAGSEMGLMAGLKTEFDPNGVLAPGRLGL